MSTSLDTLEAWRVRLERTCAACGCRSIGADGVCRVCGARKAAPAPECPACVDQVLSGRRGLRPMPAAFFARSPDLCAAHRAPESVQP